VRHQDNVRGLHRSRTANAIAVSPLASHRAIRSDHSAAR
jgi:hypothetical protein